MKFIIVIFLSISCLIASDGWNWQNPRPQGNDLRDIFIIDQDHAVAVGEFGTVMRTSNRGTDWQFQYNAGGTMNVLNAVCFIDATNGWAVGEKGTILRTDDGGISWYKQNSGTEIDLYDICFVDDQQGWCVGRWGKLLSTIDGGKTWMAEISGTQRLLRTIKFLDKDKGWIIGHGGVVLKTENGGKSWQYQVIDHLAHLRSLSVINENNIWMVGEDGFIFHSEDNGKSWQKKEVDVFGDFSSVHFFDANTGILCGYTTEYYNGIKYNGAGTILTTADGGTTWHTEIAETINPLNEMSLSSSGLGYAVGNRGTIVRIEQKGARVTTQSKSVNGTCFAVDFADKINGWIVGYQNILHTSDGGENWEQQEVKDVSELFSFSSNLHSFDANTCIAVGGSITGSGNLDEIYSQVLKTEDGGKSWSYIRHQSGEYIFDIEFIDANTGWIVGFPSLIAKTTNTGQTWQIQTPVDYNNYFWAVDFIDASTGWAVGTSGRIRKTTDGGSTWTTQRAGTSTFFSDVEFLNDQKGWIIGEGGTILKTEDGGENWVFVKSPKITGLNSISFADERHGRIVGDRGVILRTDDGGETWYEIPSKTQEDLSCIFFVDEQTGWITSYNGSILKTTSGGIDDVEQQFVDNSLLPTKLILKQNYPNPFNNATMITYQVSMASQVELSVYNLLGQRVATLVSQWQPAGQYQVQWDAGSFTSGVYLYKLSAGKFQAVKRLVLLK
jgi:photosystem II stability/assembly factor-like uncharacterized protein